MGRIIITEFVSLDGVMEGPGKGEDFKYAGWTSDMSWGDAGRKFKLNETLDSEALLLGRVTYEAFASAWPKMEGDFADKFNSLPKYVFSSTLKEATWNNSTILSGGLAEDITKLKREQTGNIVVHGSAQLARGLIANDLAEEIRLMVHPVILGEGKRLFEGMPDKKPLKLVSSRTVGDGVEILVYEPKR